MGGRELTLVWGDKNLIGGSLLGEDFSRWEEWANFRLVGGDFASSPLVEKTLGIKDENFNMGVHWKIQFLGGGLQETNRAWTVFRFKEGLNKEEGVVFLRGVDTLMHNIGCNINWYSHFGNTALYAVNNAWLLLINVFANICMISLCKPSVATIKS